MEGKRKRRMGLGKYSRTGSIELQSAPKTPILPVREEKEVKDEQR